MSKVQDRKKIRNANGIPFVQPLMQPDRVAISCNDSVGDCTLQCDTSTERLHFRLVECERGRGLSSFAMTRGQAKALAAWLITKV